MKQLKEEFEFQYQKQTVKVKKLGQVWCAVAGTTAKSLKIEFCEGVHVGKICNQEGKFLAWLPKTALREITIDDIKNDLRQIGSFYQFLEFVKNTNGLSLNTQEPNDDGVDCWLTYKGEEVEGSRKVRFNKPNEIIDLLEIAGL